jgi:hypothetical protein
MLLRLQGEHGVAMGLFDRANNWLRASPWRLLGVVCVTGFLAGCLLDLDHLPTAVGYLIGGRAVLTGRFLHGIALVGGGALCACAGGYLYQLVLMDIVHRSIAVLKNKLSDIFASQKHASHSEK